MVSRRPSGLRINFEGDPEPELSGPVLPRDTLVVLPVRLIGVQRPVRRIERVEHLDDAIDCHLPANRNPLLHAEIDTLPPRLGEAVPVDDCAVGAESLPPQGLRTASATDPAQVAAIHVL